MKLALGTAQFGLPYGIANNNGKVSASEMSKILELARKSGIHYIDTAISYGDCHDRLGQISANDFNIITPKKCKPPDQPIQTTIPNN